MRIMFMGTPDFAVPTLDALCAAGHEVCEVVTQADKPRGRGNIMTPPPVKVAAEKHGIPVIQPATLRGEEFLSHLRDVAPDMIVVVAFGKILPREVLEYPKYGCINVHGSLLPEYRGAAPMQRAVIEGKKKTGITTMYMDDGIDTGDMLLTEETEITDDDDFGTVHDRLAGIGAGLLLRTVDMLAAGKIERRKQDDAAMTYAAKIDKSELLLDFEKPADTLFNLIRGVSPVPLAFTHTADGKILKIIKSAVADGEYNGASGEVVEASAVGDGRIIVKCGNGALRLLTVLPEGKGRMSAGDLVRGRRIAPGDILK